MTPASTGQATHPEPSHVAHIVEDLRPALECRVQSPWLMAHYPITTAAKCDSRRWRVLVPSSQFTDQEIEALGGLGTGRKAPYKV